MAHQALYRQYRPQTFDDVVEQRHIVTTLRNIVVSKKIAHAYLFCGTRGTGKTTMAKIFARAVNCLNPDHGNPCNQCEICRGILDGTILDVTEIDAASNNSVDNVRGIIEDVVYTPTRASRKVYIIDEVHMLSSGAFNALLKTLEEPPQHALFILATTEPHKLPATVLSRCQRFDFRRISGMGISERLLMIAKETGVSVTEEAVAFISSLSEGALRDGISILDQCIATGRNPLTLEDVNEIIGIAPGRLILDTADYLIERNGKQAVEAIDQLITNGRDPGQFLQGLIRLFRDILVYKASDSMNALLSISAEEKERIAVLSRKVAITEALHIVRELSDTESAMKWSSSPRILMEIAFLRVCARELDREGDSLSERIGLLEEKIRRLEGKNITGAGPSAGTAKEEPRAEIQEDAQALGAQKSRKSKQTNPEEAQKSANTYEDWNCVLEELKSIGRMKIYTSLVGAAAVRLDENTVGIIVEKDDTLKKLVLSKSENIEAIAGAIKKCTGRELQVKIVGAEQQNEEKEQIPEKVVQFAQKSGIKLEIIEE